ncbi:hypothetical protein AGMMS49593_08810 [Endomicrobiia bacterium]|nr:hypothetical protein AGMMS49593_08810 [Endomicrobiia bacterium]
MLKVCLVKSSKYLCLLSFEFIPLYAATCVRKTCDVAAALYKFKIFYALDVSKNSKQVTVASLWFWYAMLFLRRDTLNKVSMVNTEISKNYGF